MLTSWVAWSAIVIAGLLAGWNAATIRRNRRTGRELDRVLAMCVRMRQRDGVQ